MAKKKEDEREQYGGGYGGQAGVSPNTMLGVLNQAAPGTQRQGMGVQPPQPDLAALQMERQALYKPELGYSVPLRNMGDYERGRYNQAQQFGGAPVTPGSVGMAMPNQARAGLAADIQTLKDAASGHSSMGMHDALLRQKIPFGGIPPKAIENLMYRYGGIYPEGVRQAGLLQSTGMQEAGATQRVGIQEGGATQRAGIQFGPESPAMRTARANEGKLGFDREKWMSDTGIKLKEIGLREDEIEHLYEYNKAQVSQKNKELGLKREQMEVDREYKLGKLGEIEYVPKFDKGGVRQIGVEPKPVYPGAQQAGNRQELTMKQAMTMNLREMQDYYRDADDDTKKYLRYIAQIRDNIKLEEE